MFKKVLIGIWILLIVVAASSAMWLLWPKKKNNFTLDENVVALVTTTFEKITSNTPTLTLPLRGGGDLITPASSSPSSTKYQGEQISQAITGKMRIGGQEFPFAVKEGSTVYDAIQALASEQKFSFSAKEYPGMGYFIEEMNGLKNGAGGKYWIYYINGEKAKVGVSNYIIKFNDIISWQYEDEIF